jgi:hypothetical protein
MRRVFLLLLAGLTACSGSPSDSEPVVVPEGAARSADEPSPALAPPDPAAPSPSPVAPPAADAACDPRVTEVLFVPDGSGSSVTILGDGFCIGAAPPTARFGDVPVTGIVVASSGKSMAGRVARMPPSGVALEVHTPPGHPVVTTYRVP